MICGLQKMTLLDFPGKIACTVFLGGCNFRCPFCHNSELFMGKPEKLMEDEDFFKFLKSRKGLLDGVCVSGGEPTLYKNLPEFLARIKELGFLVKLDTNGSRPEVVRELVEKNLVDYIAMDVKNSPAMYAQTIGLETMDLATTLADSCYSEMFRDCSSLTQAPALPATTLAEFCYSSMFVECKKLNYIKCLATDVKGDNTENWVDGVASESTFIKNKNESNWPSGNNGIPSGWTVQNA